MSGTSKDLANTLLGLGHKWLILPHERADADAIGSGLALSSALRKMGREATLYLDEEVPAYLRFMFEPEDYNLISIFDQESARAFSHSSNEENPLPADYAAIALDCHEAERMGRRSELFNKTAKRLIIDHHQGEAQEASAIWLDHTRSSSGEMTALFLLELERMRQERLIETKEADWLLAAIYADSGCLSYSNTLAETLNCCAELSKRTDHLPAIAENLFHRKSWAKLKLDALVSSIAERHANNRIISASVCQADLVACGAKRSDLDGICSALREVDGIDLAILLHEVEGSIRISLRSGDAFNSQAFAASYGGGGHYHASGFSLNDMSLEEATTLVLEAAGLRLDNAQLSGGK